MRSSPATPHQARGRSHAAPSGRDLRGRAEADVSRLHRPGGPCRSSATNPAHRKALLRRGFSLSRDARRTRRRRLTPPAGGCLGARRRRDLTLEAGAQQAPLGVRLVIARCARGCHKLASRRGREARGSIRGGPRRSLSLTAGAAPAPGEASTRERRNRSDHLPKRLRHASGLNVMWGRERRPQTNPGRGVWPSGLGPGPCLASSVLACLGHPTGPKVTKPPQTSTWLEGWPRAGAPDP